jgi:hypothetical protein
LLGLEIRTLFLEFLEEHGEVGFVGHVGGERAGSVQGFGIVRARRSM